MSKRKKIAAFRNQLKKFDDGLVVRFNPPEKFLQVKIVNEIELDASGEVDSVGSVGPCFFYRLDSELQSLLSSRKPDFFSS